MCGDSRRFLTGGSYAKEYHVERYLREVMIPRIAPVSRELCLNYIAEKVLGMRFLTSTELIGGQTALTKFQACRKVIEHSFASGIPGVWCWALARSFR